MAKDRYSFNKFSEIVTYRFQSEGPKGPIKKEVRFRLITEKNFSIYNVGFGDIISGKENYIDDRIVSNNGDQKKILIAVTEIIIEFTQARPDAFVLIKGSTESRTRLYQMWMAKLFERIDPHFLILGEVKKHWFPFKKGINYDSFLIRRR